MTEPDNANAPRLIPRSYAAVPILAARDRRLKPADHCVLIALCFHADPKGYAWPSQELLAEITDLSRQTVNGAIRRLREFGYLKIVKSSKSTRRSGGRFNVNAYVVTRKPLPESLMTRHRDSHVNDVADTDGVTTVPDISMSST